MIRTLNRQDGSAALFHDVHGHLCDCATRFDALMIAAFLRDTLDDIDECRQRIRDFTTTGS